MLTFDVAKETIVQTKCEQNFSIFWTYSLLHCNIVKSSKKFKANAMFTNIGRVQIEQLENLSMHKLLLLCSRNIFMGI